MYRILNTKGRFLIITANPETYDERKTFYKSYTIKGKLLTGVFDLGGGKALTDTTLYLHTKEEIEESIKRAGFKINYTKRMGQTSNKGLYLVVEGSKE
jgi:ubiquinone/menaquinone biosynthesis C-methylase UbiE